MMNIKRFAFSALAICMMGSAHAGPTFLAGGGDTIYGGESYDQSFFFSLDHRSLVAARASIKKTFDGMFSDLGGEVSLFDTSTDQRHLVDHFFFGSGSGGSDLTLSAGSYQYDVHTFNRHYDDVDITFEVTGVPAPVSASPDANPTPVPEPETYALMLAGLGVVGFAARRRKSV